MGYIDVRHKIEGLKEKITAHGQLTDSQKKKINYKFRLEWNYNSNSMEGNTLTVEETRSVMVGNLDVHQKPIKDVIEMKGHDEVITDIIRIGQGELRISEKRIKDIHSGIMYEDIEEDRKKIGEWKGVDNYIINRKGERYDFLPYKEVPDALHDLLNRTNADIDAIVGNKKNAKHPIDVALQFHLEFLAIHPFYDGNGRTARILTNLILISLGYPPFWITEKERDSYYAYLSDIQGYGGSVDLLDEYMANLILRSQQLILDVIEGKDIEADDDLYKEISVWKKQLVQNNDLLTYDDELVYNLYQNSFRPLFTGLLDKLSQFDDLFTKKQIINGIEAEVNSSRDVNNVNYFDEFFEVLKGESHRDKDLLYNQFDNYGRVIFLRLKIMYNGFKNDGLNTFGKSLELNVYFDQFKYSISLGGDIKNAENILLSKLYSENLTDKEIKNIVKSRIAKFFDEIKSSIKK